MAKKGLSTYDKKFYNNLLMVAQNIMYTYSIEVPSLQFLAAMMDMPFSDAWINAFNRFKRSDKGIVKKTRDGYWVEVIPF